MSVFFSFFLVGEIQTEVAAASVQWRKRCSVIFSSTAVNKTLDFLSAIRLVDSRAETQPFIYERRRSGSSVHPSKSHRRLKTDTNLWIECELEHKEEEKTSNCTVLTTNSLTCYKCTNIEQTCHCSELRFMTRAKRLKTREQG